MIATPLGRYRSLPTRTSTFFRPLSFIRSPNRKAQVRGDVGSLLGWEVPESSEYLADRWVVELNHNGVGSAVADRAASPATWNRSASAVERHPERFHSVLMVNPLLPGADMRCASALRDGADQRHFSVPRHASLFHASDHHVHSLLAIRRRLSRRRRLRALRHAERRVPQKARAALAVRHAVFEPHRSARRGAGVSRICLS